MRLFTVTLHLVTLAALAFCSVAAADLAQQKPRTHPSLKTLESYPWKTLAVGPYPNSSYKPRFAAAVQHLDKRQYSCSAYPSNPYLCGTLCCQYGCNGSGNGCGCPSGYTYQCGTYCCKYGCNGAACGCPSSSPYQCGTLCCQYGCNGDTCGCPSDSYMCSDMSGCCKTGYTCTPGTDLCAPPTSSPPPNPSPNGPGPINTNDPNNQDSKHSGLSTPAIIGISVGAVAAVGLAAAMFALKAKSAAAKAAHLAKHAGAANGHQLDPMNHGGHPNHVSHHHPDTQGYHHHGGHHGTPQSQDPSSVGQAHQDPSSLGQGQLQQGQSGLSSLGQGQQGLSSVGQAHQGQLGPSNVGGAQQPLGHGLQGSPTPQGVYSPGMVYQQPLGYGLENSLLPLAVYSQGVAHQQHLNTSSPSGMPASSTSPTVAPLPFQNTMVPSVSNKYEYGDARQVSPGNGAYAYEGTSSPLANQFSYPQISQPGPPSTQYVPPPVTVANSTFSPNLATISPVLSQTNRAPQGDAHQ